MKDAFALAAIVFVACKLFFSLLSWFFDERQTTFHWQQAHQDWYRLLHDFVQRIHKSFFSHPSTVWRLVGASLLYHSLAFGFALELMAFLESIIFEIPYDAGDGVWQFVYLDPHDRLWPWWLYVIAALCGVSFDLLSVFIMWTLLKRTEQATALSGLFFFFLIDSVLVLALLTGAGFFLLAIVSAALPREIDYPDVVLIVTHLVSVTLPTVSYCSISLAIVGMRWLPSQVRTWLIPPSQYTSSVTRPILPRLGTRIAALSALLVATLTIIL